MANKLSKLKISTKIIIPVVIVLTLSNIVTNYITSHQMDSLAKQSAKDSLNMLTDSVFLTLKNAMNTGDPKIIKQAEDDSRNGIKGLKSLIVAKSKETIELYSPDTAFTKDKETLKSFKTKKEQVIDTYTNNLHVLRVLRPMMATQECLMCHANQKEGDVIGVIDMTFSLKKADETISDTVFFVVVVSIIFILLAIIIIWLVAKKLTDPLRALKNELRLFFSFLDHEVDSIEPFEIKSMDEIGEMVEVLNENIQKTINGIKKDAKAIRESSKICEQVALGSLDVEIKADANNPEINNLANIVNKLIGSLNYNINRVLGTLELYSSDSYDARIESKGRTTGSIKKLFERVNYLGETLTKLSTQNLKNGMALQQTSKIFAKNVDSLAQSSTQQAHSVNQTSDALLDITKNIQNTTQNSKKMANLANSLNTSSAHGQKLAKKTAESMLEINDKVNTINEAISVIDQISFQTNILSLNAAVEAATAGEAGKGFAVVAGEVRNLANRSAEAASEIKALVESATVQAKIGEEIADEMIGGFEALSTNISETTGIIDSVAKDSATQKNKIEEINKAIVNIDKATQENAKVAKETNIVAQQASDIAQKIVEDAGGKKFSGKDDIKIRDNITNTNYTGTEKRKIEKEIKSHTR